MPVIATVHGAHAVRPCGGLARELRHTGARPWPAVACGRCSSVLSYLLWLIFGA